MYYKVRINTSAFKPFKCSKKNWEPGTVNCHMDALNGWHTTEKNLRHVRWRMHMFHGHTCLNSEIVRKEEHSYGLSDEYQKWKKRACNTVRYMDKLCQVERMHTPSGYGFLQGYFSVDRKIKELQENGYVRIYFSELYDGRQYKRNMDNCYMEIWKSTANYEEKAASYSTKK